MHLAQRLVYPDGEENGESRRHYDMMRGGHCRKDPGYVGGKRTGHLAEIYVVEGFNRDVFQFIKINAKEDDIDGDAYSVADQLGVMGEEGPEYGNAENQQTDVVAGIGASWIFAGIPCDEGAERERVSWAHYGATDEVDKHLKPVLHHVHEDDTAQAPALLTLFLIVDNF